MQKNKLINITNLVKKYGPGYIAKEKQSGKVVAYARRMDNLMEEIKSLKKELVISWIPKYGGRYVFSISLRLRRG